MNRLQKLISTLCRPLFLCHLVFFSALVLSSCADLRFSPYQTNVDFGRKNSNGHNIGRLETGLENHLQTHSSIYPLRIALLGDTHNYYDNFSAVVGKINNDDEVDLVIQVGDITNLGLLEEYEWAYDIFSRIRRPFLVVIGNHDAISFGKDIYSELFGSYNFSFVYGEIHFIFFNNNDLEFRPASIDYSWLKKQLLHRREELIKIVVSHIPPWADRSFRSTQKFEEILVNHGVELSLHGHTNRGFQEHESGSTFIGAGDVRSRRYGYLDILNNRQALYREFGGQANQYNINF